jgi:hypothetical protein
LVTLKGIKRPVGHLPVERSPKGGTPMADQPVEELVLEIEELEERTAPMAVWDD